MYLGLDLGTTNVKAVLMDQAGRAVCAGATAIGCVHGPGGSAEQDIEEIWRATCEAIRQALGGEGEAPATREEGMPSPRRRAPLAVGVSSQGGAIQLLDRAESPLGPVISWLDSRGRPYDDAITRRLGAEFFSDRLGHGSSGVAVGQILRLREATPGLLAAPNRVAFVGDVIVGRLCGRRAHDATSLSIAMLYNPHLDRADPELLRHLGLAEDQLPELLPPTAIAGKLTAAAAEATGLPAGIPVSPAIHDQYAAALGVGAARAGDLSLGTGTAWVLLAATKRHEGPVTPGAFLSRHVVPGLYGQLLSMVNGGSAIQWAMGLLGHGKPAVGDVDALASAAPPGADGLRFWPLLANCPSAGAMAGQGGRLGRVAFAHSDAHLVRAVIEGLACELARHLNLLAAEGLAVERLRVSGGAAGSRITPQVLADVTGRPVTCCSQEAVSAFGAAVLARAMLEGDLVDLSCRLAPGGRTFSPGPDAALYRDVLAEYLRPFDAPRLSGSRRQT